MTRAFTGVDAQPSKGGRPKSAVVSFPWWTAPQERCDLPQESVRRSHLPSRVVGISSKMTSARVVPIPGDDLAPQVLIGHLAGPELPIAPMATRSVPVTA